MNQTTPVMIVLINDDAVKEDVIINKRTDQRVESRIKTVNDDVEYYDDDKDKATRGNQILKELSLPSVKVKSIFKCHLLFRNGTHTY